METGTDIPEFVQMDFKHINLELNVDKISFCTVCWGYILNNWSYDTNKVYLVKPKLGGWYKKWSYCQVLFMSIEIVLQIEDNLET